MKKYALLLIVVLVVLSGCAAPVVRPVPSVPLDFDMETGVATKGNMHYIPLNLEGTLHRNIGLVFQKIQDWEDSNPNKEIVDIDYVWRPETYGRSAEVYGIIIYSKLIE
jgi:hypothetical protein